MRVAGALARSVEACAHHRGARGPPLTAGLAGCAEDLAVWVEPDAGGLADGADGSDWTGDACTSGILRGGSFEHTAPLPRASARLEVSLTSPISHSFGVRCCFAAP